jgi:hypothetical protein
MTDAEAAGISRAFRQAFHATLGISPDEPLPEQPPTKITLPLRAEAWNVLIEMAEYRSVPPLQMAENILASRLKTLGKRIRKKKPSYDRYKASQTAQGDPTET